MQTTRRKFLQAACLAPFAARQLSAAPALNPDSLTKFVDPLPIPAILKPSGTRPVPGGTSPAPFYRVAVREFRNKLHRDLPAARLWGYNGSVPGPTFEARSGQGMFVEWANQLPEKHFLPIDHTVMGAEPGVPESRIVVHLHGAKIPPDYDGYPEDWYAPGKSKTYFYANGQDAATLWYHDHSMGINRLNAYAGMFGMYLLRDDAEDALNLPKGAYEIPLVICDRLLRQDGELDYPTSGDPAKPWVPEVFGNVMLANGKAFPYLDVEARQYRFRVLNAANGRFMHLALSNEQKFRQIGCDQGLLEAPVELDKTMLAPGERGDLIVDFSGRAGEKIVLMTDLFSILQFRVGPAKAAGASRLPATLRAIPKTPESSAVKTRQMVLFEQKTLRGESMAMTLNNTPWHAPVTENPVLDSTEIWTFVNLTDDSHPIHLHLVRFRILDRRNFDHYHFTNLNQLYFTGPPVPPDPEEAGWKDTVRAHPGMVTRIIVKFEGWVGRYVWHCHVLEHEDNEMMRPYEVIPAS